jgi:sugar/nucleoside kinase (ribokinase family)
MPRFDVTIAGELNLDLILYGLPNEMPLERELLADRMMLTLGGSSAIVAHNLAALGSRVGFQARIGDDELGRIARTGTSHNWVDRHSAENTGAQHTHLSGYDGGIYSK